jgi:hypothetical protein
MGEVIRYMSRKESTGYSTFVPFGVVSNNVTMNNLNTLEEEFKVGGNCITSIVESSEDDGSTTTHIVEEYRENDVDGDYYKVVTDIVEASDGTTTIMQEMFYVDSTGSEKSVKKKTVTFAEDDNGTTITEVVE